MPDLYAQIHSESRMKSTSNFRWDVSHIKVVRATVCTPIADSSNLLDHCAALVRMQCFSLIIDDVDGTFGSICLASTIS